MNRLDEQLKRIKELLSEGEGDVGRGAGGTSTNSSGQYMSAHAWQEGGILTKDGRKDDIGEKPSEVDITKDSETVTLTVDDVMGDDPSGEIVDVIDDLLINPHSQGELPVPTKPYGDDRDPTDDPGDPSGGDDDIVGPAGGHGCPCSEAQIFYLNYAGYVNPPNPQLTHHPLCCPSTGGHEDERADTTFGGTKRGATPCCEPCQEKQGWWKRCHDDSEDACKYATIAECELVDKEGESNLDSLSLGDIWGTE